MPAGALKGGLGAFAAASAASATTPASGSTPPRRSLREGGLALWQRLERAGDGVLGARGNPLRHLGAVGFLAFWLLGGTGIVLYVMLDTSVSGAYRSIAGLNEWPLGLGRLLRGVHRYAADLLVLAMGAHLLREWLHGHERGVRRFPWLTGVPLIGFVFICAIGGFWLNWDALGQFSAVATAEWLDALPWVFATPLSRNFLAADQVSDRLFSLFIFVHLGVPLLLLFGLWFHIQRLTRAAVLPPRGLAWGLVVALAALALVLPVQSHEAAAMARVAGELRLDWMLLFVHPLTYATSPAVMWVVFAVAGAVLFGLPFLPQPARPAPAVVDAAHCNGCQRCFADCPYAAITMVAHPNQRIGRTLAVVDADLCVACGICAGACPSSTPFRSRPELVSGIDMPQRRIDTLRRQLAHALDECAAARPLVVFGCDCGARPAAPQHDRQDGRDAHGDVVWLPLLCTGQLPPSFVEYALRDGAAGVLVAACDEGGCEFRLGEQITLERLAGAREPHLRAQVERDRVELVFAGRGREAALADAAARLRARVARLPAPGVASPPVLREGVAHLPSLEAPHDA
ncbi:MAG: hydrogenase iron-sulfur subunit [Burkholderiales bacterium]|nr:hydrogenase iron-sulfur subunit [Burkholderiales bacterium]